MTKHTTSVARTVKLFRNGRSQAVRIPREFELPGKAAIMRRRGNALIIEPAPRPRLLDALAGLGPLNYGEFPDIPDLPTDPVEL